MTQTSRHVESSTLRLVIDAEAMELLEQAAQVEQRSVADLVVEAAIQHASEVLDPQRQILVGKDELARILEELDREPEPLPELRKAFEKARALRSAETR